LPSRLRPLHLRNVRVGDAMKPIAVVLAFEPRDQRQSIVADAIRSNFAELIKLSPAERKVRIDEILRANKEPA
jgi:hypothetical protein